MQWYTNDHPFCFFHTKHTKHTLQFSPFTWYVNFTLCFPAYSSLHLLFLEFTGVNHINLSVQHVSNETIFLCSFPINTTNFYSCLLLHSFEKDKFPPSLRHTLSCHTILFSSKLEQFSFKLVTSKLYLQTQHTE